MNMIKLPSLEPTTFKTETIEGKEEKVSELSYQTDLEYLASLFGISPYLIEQLSQSIGCSRNEASLQWILDLTILPNKQLRFGRGMRRKLYTVTVQGNYQGAKLGLKFMKENYLAMNQRYDDMGLVFKAFADHIHTDELRLMVRYFQYVFNPF